jgi:uncharacterized repeat protein (TIGR01451 family)
MKNINTKILILSVLMLLSGLFAFSTPASALTCNSVTLTGDVITGTPPARARFTYGTDYNTVANGGGTPTTVQTFYSDGPIQQFVSGLMENTTYYFRLEVTNNYDTAYLNINNFTTPSCNPNPTYNYPTVSLYASPASIQSGQSSSLNWSSQNASYCSSSWSGNSSVSGYATVYPTYTTNYTITCYGTNGQQVNASATVYVNQTQQICLDVNANNYRGVLPCTYYNRPIVINNQPTVTVYSDLVSVPYNGAATVRWITTNASSCNASGGSIGWEGVKSIGPGSFYTGSLTSTKTFTLTCSNSFGSASDSETINVRGPSVTNARPNPTSLVLVSSSIDRNQPIVPSIDNTSPRPGDEINYTINYQNIGTGAITNLVLQTNLPKEVDYLSSNPSNPTISGNTLVFNLGTLRANGKGVVTIRTRVLENIPNETKLDFPAILSYVDPSGQTQSVNANVSAEVSSETEDGNVFLGANVFGAGFLPTNLFGWLLLLILVLILIYLAKNVYDQSFRKTTTVVTDQPSGKRTTTTTEH